METISITIVQLETNLRTLRKESSSRRPMRKRQLKQCDSNSLMRKFQAKRVATAATFDVDFLRSPHSSITSPPKPVYSDTTSYNSPRSIKLPKWPSPCPGTPSFPYSPRKLLLASKNNSPTEEVSAIFKFSEIIIIKLFLFFYIRTLQCSARLQYKSILINIILIINGGSTF